MHMHMQQRERGGERERRGGERERETYHVDIREEVHHGNVIFSLFLLTYHVNIEEEVHNCNGIFRVQIARGLIEQ
jgi:hypothetical protein